jgi:hypothetical protein
MGKRSAVVELFLGDMGSMQRELWPSIQREDQLTMETKLEQIAVKAVNQLPKSVVREIRTPRSVGTGGGRPPPVTRSGGGRPPPATRWARRNPRPYRDHAGDPTIRSARLSSHLANGILASRCIGHGDSRRRRSPHLACEIIIKSLQLATSEGAACRQSGCTFFDVATCN